MTDESHVRCRHCRRAAPRVLVWATDGCCPWCHRQLTVPADEDRRLTSLKSGDIPADGALTTGGRGWPRAVRDGARPPDLRSVWAVRG
jgi:hypothetical protein